jgi:DNA-binding transcriptional MocR family regulator
MSSHRKRRTTIGGQFAWRLIEMLESPAYQVLSQSGHRILARLEIEIAHHGGKDNGRLPVTFEDFQKYRIDRHAIAPAMRECEALGFVEITERGRAGNAEFRLPNKFRLTYRETAEAGPTNDWRRVKTIKDAQNLAYEAEGECQKNGIPMGESATFRWGNPTLKREPYRWGKSPLQPYLKNPHHFRYLG